MAKNGKRMRLEDLYQSGRRETFKDNNGNKVDVWLAKLGDADHQSAINHAAAARARSMLSTGDPTSDHAVILREQLLQWGTETQPLVDFLAYARVQKKLLSTRAEVEGAEQSEWAKDRYIESLRDAWLGIGDDNGLREVWMAHEAGDMSVDPILVDEAKRVLAELTRFDTEVEARVQSQLEEAKADLVDVDLVDLRDLAFEQFREDLAAQAWDEEFRHARLFYGVREVDDRNRRHFSNIEAVRRLDKELKDQVIKAYLEMIVDDLEGKDLPRPRSSSELSAPPETAATSGSSGPEAAAA